MSCNENGFIFLNVGNGSCLEWVEYERICFSRFGVGCDLHGVGIVFGGGLDGECVWDCGVGSDGFIV